MTGLHIGLRVGDITSCSLLAAFVTVAVLPINSARRSRVAPDAALLHLSYPTYPLSPRSPLNP